MARSGAANGVNASQPFGHGLPEGQPQHVHQRRFRLAVSAGQQLGEPVGRHVEQVLSERAVLIVNFASRSVLDAERLNGCDDHDRLAFHRRARQPQRFLDRHYLDRPAREFERAAVRVARIAQRIGGLVEYGIARHEP